MLFINSSTENDTLTLKLEGKLDTTTASQFETVINERLEGISNLIIDFEHLEYLSSAGLRVLLAAQKIMNKQGSMKLVNVDSMIMEIFEITGFTDIMTVE